MDLFIFDDDVNIDYIVGRMHEIGGRMIYTDKIKGKYPWFIPSGKRRKMNLWHNYKNKFE